MEKRSFLSLCLELLSCSRLPQHGSFELQMRYFINRVTEMNDFNKFYKLNWKYKLELEHITVLQKLWKFFFNKRTLPEVVLFVYLFHKHQIFSQNLIYVTLQFHVCELWSSVTNSEFIMLRFIFFCILQESRDGFCKFLCLMIMEMSINIPKYFLEVFKDITQTLC